MSEQIPGLPEPNLTATLSYIDWCTVMAALAAGPYRDVAPVIDRLMTQISPQADAQQAQAILAVATTPSDLRN